MNFLFMYMIFLLDFPIKSVQNNHELTLNVYQHHIMYIVCYLYIFFNILINSGHKL